MRVALGSIAVSSLLAPPVNRFRSQLRMEQFVAPATGESTLHTDIRRAPRISREDSPDKCWIAFISDYVFFCV
jgi:hypothetical protein